MPLQVAAGFVVRDQVVTDDVHGKGAKATKFGWTV
jgi:hypothetical protein